MGSEKRAGTQLRRIAATVTLGLVSVGCGLQAPQSRDNAALRQQIHASVPEQWRASADLPNTVAPLNVSPKLSEFVHSATPHNARDREKLLSLIDAILSDEGIGLVYDANATYTADEAFESGVANCLGFSNLFIASARTLGLDAKYELVQHNLRWDRADEDVVVGTLHVRVVSMTKTSRMVFDFYPLPLRSGFDAEPLSDSAALAHHLNNLAADAIRAGDYANAYGYMYKALATEPGIAFIWSNLGILLARNELDRFAEAAYREALAISPEQLSALSNLQHLYYEQGRLQEAEQLKARLEHYRRQNPYYHAARGEQAHDDGDYAAAVRHFKNAIELKADDIDFYSSLAETYAALGMDDAAARMVKKREKIEEPRSRTYRQERRKAPTGSHITRR